MTGTARATIPAIMRVAVMYDVDDIRIEERPVPALAPGDLLVATGASGVCSGDLMPWYVRRKAPFVFGHEPAGTVVAVGGDAVDAPFAVGTRVFAHHHAPCMGCAHCAAGRYVHCATWRTTSLDPGGMAEFFRVPRANVADTLALPDGVSFADGSLVEPLACVVKSLRRAFAGALRATNAFADERALAGRTLLVVGAGVMGLMHVALARALGATAFASDFDASRRAAASELGAHATFAPEDALAGLRDATAGGLADVVVCGPGSPAALEASLDLVGADGTLLMFTPIEPGQRMSFDQSAAYFRDVRLVSSYSCGPDDTAASLALIVRGIVTAERLGVREFAFPAVADAYAAMAGAKLVKAIVTFETSERSSRRPASG